MRTIVYWLSLLLIFMIPWENAVTIGNLGTLIRATGVLVAAVWVGAIVVTGRFRRPHPFHLAFYLFILWNVASGLWTFYVDGTIQRIQTYFQLAGLAIILWDLYTTPAALKAGLLAYVLGAYVTIANTVRNYFTGIEVSTYSGGRYTGAGLNAGDLALILALGLPVAWHLAASTDHGIKNSILKLVNYAYIPAALFAILLTASRMPLFAVLPTAVFIVGTATQLKPLSRMLVFVVLAGALLAVLSFVPQSSIDRLATTGASVAARDLGGRANLWHESVVTFSEHPILGVGSNALNHVIALGSVAHNTFISVLAELGIIGFVLFVAIVAMSAYQAIHQPKGYSLLWLTVLAVWAIGVSAQTWEHRKATWLFLSLVFVSASLFNQPDESKRRLGPPNKSYGLPNSRIVQRAASSVLEVSTGQDRKG